MARKPTHDWSALLSLLLQRQGQDPSYKNKQFAEDEDVPLGSLARALTKYRKGEIELTEESDSDHKNDRNSDHKNDHNNDQSNKLSTKRKSSNKPSKQKLNGKLERLSGGSTRNSDQLRTEVGAKRQGGQKGNRNAVTHGLYSQYLTPELKATYELAFDAAGGVDGELALARAKLAEAFRKKGEQEALEQLIQDEQIKAASEPAPQPVVDEDGNAVPSNSVPARFNYAAMQPEAFEDNIGPLGMTIKMKRTDWDAVIDRWIGRVANLESLRQKLQQGHNLSHAERTSLQSTIFNKLAEGTIDGITAGNMLSANAIDIPTNLLAQIRAELGHEEDESELPKGGVTPQIIEAREKQLQEGNAQDAADFMAERLAELDELNVLEINAHD